MKRTLHLVSIIALLALAAGCGSTQKKESGIIYKKPEKINFRFIGYDRGIDNPENDRRSYYKIFIDKTDEGRTTAGLESQDKTFEATLSPNRHLITIEKWVLDQKMGRYIKLNNIDQPKPSFIYFDVPENRIVIIKMQSMRDGEAEFKVDFERD